MLHELIDQDNPKCLYCNTSLDLDVSSVPHKGAVIQEEIRNCNSCKEVFRTFSWYDDTQIKYTIFAFTCKKYTVWSDYSEPHLTILDRNTAAIIVNIPFFEIDFSNKEKLCEKIKTYLVFS